jgi:hypothetical protein
MPYHEAVVAACGQTTHRAARKPDGDCFAESSLKAMSPFGRHRVNSFAATLSICLTAPYLYMQSVTFVIGATRRTRADD